ncbi:phage major tail tube protein [Burkholderia sp. TSV86]|uniref:phage major tail tube protein n=1 Tax=Burkholderia sp. TSV86 TaxID=1385594 RepID=UPI000754D5D6|nr:phage major tail tube protein [Burkholderia sp. TSV86]KVE33906.1 phage tail protein [Burkholderia sp. TSV86]
MAAREVLKNLTLWADGRGYAGQVRDVNPPKLTQKTEDFQGGGMVAPLKITVGMEGLTTDFSLISYDRNVLSLFGVTEGANVPLTIRGALESGDGTVIPVMMNMRGKVIEQDPGTWKPGEVPFLKIQMALNYYKLLHHDKVVTEIDVENMIATINGADTLAAFRSALGL